jgi:hypothetical protein
MGGDELGAIGAGPTPLDVSKRREGGHLLDGDGVDTICDGVAESAARLVRRLRKPLLRSYPPLAPSRSDAREYRSKAPEQPPVGVRRLFRSRARSAGSTRPWSGPVQPLPSQAYRVPTGSALRSPLLYFSLSSRPRCNRIGEHRRCGSPRRATSRLVADQTGIGRSAPPPIWRRHIAPPASIRPTSTTRRGPLMAASATARFEAGRVAYPRVHVQPLSVHHVEQARPGRAAPYVVAGDVGGIDVLALPALAGWGRNHPGAGCSLRGSLPHRCRGGAWLGR